MMKATGSILIIAWLCVSCTGQIMTSEPDEQICADGQVVSRCICGGDLVESGFCCGGLHQGDPCGGEVDNDGDGYYESADCDDNDAAVNPGAEEVCEDGKDNDCADGDAQCVVEVDEDGDGYNASVDCDDNDASVNPGATEVCEDGQDNDCSGGDAVCPSSGGDGIWISRDEVMALPMDGDAWSNLRAEADGSTGTPNLSDQNDSTNVRVMAKALVHVRTGEQRYRDDVLAALRVVTYDNTESGGRTLALGRELIAYVIAADLIDLPSVDAGLDADFRSKLRELLTKELSGKTLVSTHEDRPNNWGTHAGASRLAVAVYLEDGAELQRAADVFRGWLGERSAYSDFTYGDLSWQCDSQSPVGVNPAGCAKNGHDVDGVIPDDQRRCGGFVWPPCKTNYAWESLQGALAQAQILHRRGYPAWDWGDQALLRAAVWLHNTAFDDGRNYPAEGDDGWQPWLINYYYCTDFPAPSPARPGKNVGWTDWTHSLNPACR